MKKIVIILLGFMLSGRSLEAQYHRIGNLAVSDHYLHTETGGIASGPIGEGWWSAHWKIISVPREGPDVFCIVNRWTDCALEAEKGILTCSPFDINSENQHWTKVSENNNGYSLLLNTGTSGYLCEQNNRLILKNTDKEDKTALWKISDFNTAIVSSGNSGNNTTDEPPKVDIATLENAENDNPVAENPVSFNGTLNREQIEAFVNSHNAVRAEVGTLPVKWSPKVAAFAQQWANQLANEKGCSLIHSQGNEYGENIYQGSEIVLSNPGLVVESWASEKPDYDGGVIKRSLKAGHYTQVIWGKTTEIGCGLAVCPDKSSFFGSVIAVCNYNPGGNVLGQSPLSK
ncbi:MAG: hypothetical protein K1X92_00475 [Bacteroidia bacterium]|nr:hypothetical protein [Bacteroidia bacterium]